MTDHFYPTQNPQRNRWVTARRGPSNAVDPFEPYAFLSEEEPDKDGNIESISTVFLTNRECPWKCVMCDLWKNTLRDTVPLGAIPAQIDYALERLPRASVVKLYNSGSFFDPRAIPTADYQPIADRLKDFRRVIVECHPALVNEACLNFQRMLKGELEIAIGLETAHPQCLEKLNKGMSLALFSTAARFLRDHGISLRVFLLVHPPFIDPAEADIWVQRSIEVAFDEGATIVSLIPTRGGNGAMESLEAQGLFTRPTLDALDRALERDVMLRRGRVFADLWDLEQLSTCNHCFAARRARLVMMNRTQCLSPPIECDHCGAGFAGVQRSFA